MTPCEKLGYKVGDKFEITGDALWGNKLGDVITLVKDDGTDCPKFSGLVDIAYYSLSDIKKITTENEWIRWSGGARPVDKNCFVEVEHRDDDREVGPISRALAGTFDWEHKKEYWDVVAYRVVDDGWIEWHGGECPVDMASRVSIKLRNGSVTHSYPSGSLDWRHGIPEHATDIIAYRLSAVEKEATPGTDEEKAGVYTDEKPVTRHDIIDAIFETGTVIDLSDAMEIAETIVSKFNLEKK